MWTERIFVLIWRCFSIKGEVFASKTGLPYPRGSYSIRFCFVRTNQTLTKHTKRNICCVWFVLSVFGYHLSFFRCLWKTLLPECGISWVYSLKVLLLIND